jgi:hypothetical protein
MEMIDFSLFSFAKENEAGVATNGAFRAAARKAK